MIDVVLINPIREKQKLKRLEKKSRIALLFTEQFDNLGGRTKITYQEFADWLSEPLVQLNMPEISKQNINEWHRQIRLPYKDKFEMILRIADEDSGQYQFAEKVMRVLNE
jgi:hypothetical protein